MAGPFTSRAFRDALSVFATGVTIVTARDAAGEPVGMTASSFNSVSVDPPLVLWSAAKKALSGPAFRDADHFAVHVLAVEQAALSSRFAQTGTDKFAGVDWIAGAHDVPHLAGCSMRFDCTQHAVHDGGDHWIIVGRVEQFEEGGGSVDGLLFARGAYGRAVKLPKPAKD